MKRTIILFLLFHVALLAHAQKAKLAEAVELAKGMKWEEAKSVLDAVSNHPETKDVADTWYLRGFVYKELYKKSDANNPASSNRLTALESFKKSIQLDTEKKILEKNKKNIKFLSQTFYNDAVKTLDKDNYKLSLDNFNHFKSTSKILDPNADMKDKVIEYNLGLTAVYMELYEADRGKNESFLQKTKDAYNLVLKLDPKNLSANYNMGVLFYNQAVNIILELEYDTDMIALSEIQDNCVKLFRESLPYMERALELDPNNINTLKGLSGIYYSLNEIEKSEEIKKTIEKKKKNQ